jgi:hypothetical protein
MTLHIVNNEACKRVRQGDIFSNIPYYESYNEHNGEFELNIYEFPYVIVLTQDCDLEQNASAREKISSTEYLVENDKHIISLLVAPIYNSENFVQGKHLEGIGIKSQTQNSKLKKPIMNNQNQRYHNLEFADDVVVPNSVIDFKHYFSISLSYLESNQKKRICGIEPLYRELISQRFSNYLCRIGLPAPAVSTESTSR